VKQRSCSELVPLERQCRIQAVFSISKGEHKGDSEQLTFQNNHYFLILPKTDSMTGKYNKKLKPLARNLRKFGTKAEAILWRDVLKAKQHWPYQFNRQFIIGEYIVDFICRKLKLIIEIDGSSHLAKNEEDFVRQEFLESQGYAVLRFSESIVVYRIDDVVAEIDYAIKCLEQKIEDEKEKSSD
jgi:very-short-patch-repair endonuclease